MTGKAVAVSTGAGHRIGAAFAVALGEPGGQVILASRDQEPLEAVAARIDEADGESAIVAGGFHRSR